MINPLSLQLITQVRRQACSKRVRIPSGSRSLYRSSIPTTVAHGTHSRGLSADRFNRVKSPPIEVLPSRCLSTSAKGKLHIAHIALGSNLGNRKAYIEQALTRLDSRGIQVINSSPLYESDPMYVTDQPQFLNGACSVLTSLEPHDLMRACQQIETEMGRVKLVDKGARCIDLDILLYDNEEIHTDSLTVPHIGIQERDFVYVPLSDITDLDEHNIAIPMEKIVSHSLKLHQPYLNGNRTNIMLIYNATPDSFSDGSQNSLENLPTFLEGLKGSADIIDVGGQSTRPSSTLLTAEEEAARAIPIIRKMRVLGWSGRISIDTFYASVARKALEAGADIINDVSGGRMDPEMLTTAAAFDCPIILMHMRGSPQTMQDEMNLNYDTQGGVVSGMMSELNETYRAAIAAGVRTWNIILDPGISFSKTTKQNLELLRTPLGGKIPWLVGASRKGFIGQITKVEQARKRQLGTAVCVAASIAQGARIVRVHDREMIQAVRMADAIYHDIIT